MIYLNIKGRNQHKVGDGSSMASSIQLISTNWKIRLSPISTGFRDKRKRQTHHQLGHCRPKMRSHLASAVHTPRPARDIQNPALSSYCMAEGYEHDHDDSMATSLGRCGSTSAGPIFIATGPGIKKEATIPIASSVKLMSHQPSRNHYGPEECQSSVKVLLYIRLLNEERAHSELL